MTKIFNRQETLKQIKSNPSFAEILKKAPANERKQIIATVDYVIGSMYDALMFAAANKDATNSEISKDVAEAVKTGDGIIKESDGSPIKPKEK